MVVSRPLGPPTVIRPGDAPMDEATRAGVFNRINWDRLRPAPSEGLVDSNASPVLLWVPGPVGESFGPSSGYDAKGTRVWGSEQGSVRPDLDIELGFVNNVYALPEALGALESGAVGR